jgi:hypothetical protein
MTSEIWKTDYDRTNNEKVIGLARREPRILIIFEWSPFARAPSKETLFSSK